MSVQAVALNAHILLPKRVKSVFEGVGRRCFDDMLRKSIPVYNTYNTTLWLKNVRRKRLVFLGKDSLSCALCELEQELKQRNLSKIPLHAVWRKYMGGGIVAQNFS